MGTIRSVDEFIKLFKDNIERQPEIKVRGKRTKEFYNACNDFAFTRPEIKNFVKKLKRAPLQEDATEREFCLVRTGEMVNRFLKDKNSRQLCFCNSYDGYDDHCISYFQFLFRDEVLHLNVYIRSQNFDKNFFYDLQTFCLMVLLYDESGFINNYQININWGSLHRIYG